MIYLVKCVNMAFVNVWGYRKQPESTEHCISIIHSNIRSIRNKLEFIKNNLLDFDVLCFTESHRDANVDSESLLLPDGYDSPYRKDRTNHGGGILVYMNKNIISQRLLDLEVYWNESIWLKIKHKSTYAKVHDPHTTCLKCFP